jgi:di/tricarboxylate transporter
LVILCVILVWVGRYSIELNGDRVDAGDILAGFGDDALIAITALMILARGLETTNALQPVGRALAELWRIRPKLAFLATMLTVAALSMFLNNTMPAMARSNGRRVGARCLDRLRIRS